jgi:hypothetical protein
MAASGKVEFTEVLDQESGYSELYESLEQIVSNYAQKDPTDDHWTVVKARAALAHARGEKTHE